MRKLFVIVGLAFAVSSAFGQKIEKLDDVKEKISKGKYDEAKEKLDKVFENPAANSSPEALFYRAQVYQNLAKTSQDSAMYAEALNSMQKYLQLEQSKPENQRALQSTLENHKTLFDIYQSYFNRGVENFKGNKWSTAFYNFQSALKAFDLMKNNNFTNTKFDTTVNLYAGYSAQNAQLYNEAAKYYDKLIENNIADTSYVGIYRFMINNNLDAKDTAAAKKYLDISEQRFPMYKDIWLDYRTLFLPNDKPRRFDEYETLVKANPTNETLAMNYAIEMYNYLRSSDQLEKDSALRARVEGALKNVLTMNPSANT
ncbi:MAG TPA: hypothetical protein VFL47_04580, partial [Flavisolibacter sp.]|nr:hypothetical protein [Flavisolibacter sp.]